MVKSLSVAAAVIILAAIIAAGIGLNFWINAQFQNKILELANIHTSLLWMELANQSIKDALNYSFSYVVFNLTNNNLMQVADNPPTENGLPYFREDDSLYLPQFFDEFLWRIIKFVKENTNKTLSLYFGNISDFGYKIAVNSFKTPIGGGYRIYAQTNNSIPFEINYTISYSSYFLSSSATNLLKAKLNTTLPSLALSIHQNFIMEDPLREIAKNSTRKLPGYCKRFKGVTCSLDVEDNIPVSRCIDKLEQKAKSKTESLDYLSLYGPINAEVLDVVATGKLRSGFCENNNIVEHEENCGLGVYKCYNETYPDGIYCPSGNVCCENPTKITYRAYNATCYASYSASIDAAYNFYGNFKNLIVYFNNSLIFTNESVRFRIKSSYP